jgi:HNH endonuclease
MRAYSKMTKEQAEKISQALRGREKPNRSTPRFFICQQCDTQFKNLKCYKLIKFCSKQCEDAAPRATPKFFICQTCGVQFDNWNYVTDVKFCSRKCKGAAGTSYETRKKISLSRIGTPAAQSGPESHFWRGGTTKGRDRFRNGQNQVWRAAVYERDQYRCQHCGLPGKKTIGSRGIGLDTAHLKPFARYPESRYDVDNGITLCRPCHIAFDVKNGHRGRPVKRIPRE